jgi:carbamoyl-phosphate synthase large subunit
MIDSFNILITSISRKVPLITAVRKATKNLNLACKLYGGDSHATCIARYFVDEFWQMPLQQELTIEELINFCEKNKIKAIIPTRDGELPFFSAHCEHLAHHGVSCLISKQESIETCLNKLLFYQFLTPFNIPVIPTAKDIKLISGPAYVVKECFGAGSHAIGLHLNLAEALDWSKNLKFPIFQPFIAGKEYSIDVYIDRNHSPRGAIARKRELVIGGESQITYSVHHQAMEDLCLKTADLLGLYGHAVFQVLCDASDQLHLIECNPRFGGASTLSVEMGLRSFEWFIQECRNQPLQSFKRSAKEMKMVRYPEDKVFTL